MVTVHSPQGGELMTLAQHSLAGEPWGAPGWQAVKWVTQWVSLLPENLPHPPSVKGAGPVQACVRLVTHIPTGDFLHLPGRDPTPGTQCWCELSPLTRPPMPVLHKLPSGPAPPWPSILELGNRGHWLLPRGQDCRCQVLSVGLLHTRLCQALGFSPGPRMVLTVEQGLQFVLTVFSRVRLLVTP